ncbi:HPr family phosphocarrier protein [Caloramator australicus]|uniref:Phosphocarrier protein HPr n=1 Tax=Caloramator australicus RC3 TaxID=857293 RepID=G0V3T0_9CLOT|nr:Phosphocarrier protein of PTS system [Caloramator australicus RC3]
MKEILVKINNPTGLHARPASILVKEAMKFKSNIYLIKNNKEYNAKSIMNVMAMGAAMGDEIRIKAEGEDEKEAINSLQKLLEDLKD